MKIRQNTWVLNALEKIRQRRRRRMREEERKKEEEEEEKRHDDDNATESEGMHDGQLCTIISDMEMFIPRIAKVCPSSAYRACMNIGPPKSHITFEWTLCSGSLPSALLQFDFSSFFFRHFCTAWLVRMRVFTMPYSSWNVHFRLHLSPNREGYVVS